MISRTCSTEYETKARCSSCFWGGWVSQCGGSADFLACPKCSKVSIIRYETVITRQEFSKCAVSGNHKEPEESGLDENGKVKKRWWQK